jgi:hypothetical protein
MKLTLMAEVQEYEDTELMKEARYGRRDQRPDA